MPHGYFHAYRRLSESDVDVVLHLGDQIYECALILLCIGHFMLILYRGTRTSGTTSPDTRQLPARCLRIVIRSPQRSS